MKKTVKDPRLSDYKFIWLRENPFLAFFGVTVFAIFLSSIWTAGEDSLKLLFLDKVPIIPNSIDLQSTKIFELIFLLISTFLTLFIWKSYREESRSRAINLFVRELVGNIKLLGPFTKKGVEDPDFIASLKDILQRSWTAKKFPVPADLNISEPESDTLKLMAQLKEDFLRKDFNGIYFEHRFNLFRLNNIISRKILDNEFGLDFFSDRKLVDSIFDLDHSYVRYNYFYDLFESEHNIYNENFEVRISIINTLSNTSYDWVLFRLYFCLFYLLNHDKYKKYIVSNMEMEGEFKIIKDE